MHSTRPIRALMRGLDVLAILNCRDGASVSEIAHEARLPRTTVYRILETLRESGFLSRDAAAERYRLTGRVRALSAGFEEEQWFARIARPCLLELGETIVWPVHIAALDRGKLRVREATDSFTPLAIGRDPAGMQLPLLTTSAGRVYLACCGDAHRAALLETEHGAHRRQEMESALAETRTLGYATAARTRGSLDEISISVPIRLQLSLAVLTVRFASSAVPMKTGLERFLPKLRHCAARIAGRAESAPRTAV